VRATSRPVAALSRERKATFVADGRERELQGRVDAVGTADGAPPTEPGGTHEALRARVADLELRVAEARAAERKAEEANRAKDEFLRVLSHELRTPLNAVVGWAQLLRTDRLDPATREKAGATIERNAWALARLVDDLVDASRAVAGEVELKLGPVDVGALVRRAVEAHRPAAHAKGLDLVASIDDVGGPYTGDSVRLSQMLMNLLSNAVKLGERRASVRVERVGAELTIRVENDGRGVAADVLPLVSDRAKRAEHGVLPRHGGLGLALSIACNLAELHGGSVHAPSERTSGGAAFTVVLPARPWGRASADPAQASATDLSGVFVLLVDDDVDARAALERGLTSHGAAVSVVPSVDAAMAVIDVAAPDVVVCNDAQSGQSGFDLIARLRGSEAGRGGDVPAIALTARATAEGARRALAAGFQRHLAKPVEPDEVVCAVASLVSATRRRSS
jgi:signal transduction histidine kinase/CheY-like chemotaxis protein